MLKGKAKTDYQREYMRKLRLKGKMLDPSVRPLPFVAHPKQYEVLKRMGKATGFIPECALDADDNPIPEYE